MDLEEELAKKAVTVEKLIRSQTSTGLTGVRRQREISTRGLCTSEEKD